jgi:hypothetical protein
VSGANSRPWSIEKGKGLILPTQRNEPGRSADIENIFLRPASGNWEVVSKVHFPKAPNANYQQIAAIIWQDELNYIKFNHESNGGAQKTQAVAKIGGALNANFVTFYGSLAPMNADGSVTIYYKFKKEGNLYSCSFSSDGYEYDPPATIEFNMLNPHIGFFATENSASAVIPTHAEFVCVTEYYGLTDTQQDAAKYGFDQVVDYVKNDLTEHYSSVKVGDELTIPAIPHGYSITLASDNTNVLEDNGKIVADGRATLSATLSMGKFSETIEVVTYTGDVVAEASEKDGKLSVDVLFRDGSQAFSGANAIAAIYNAKGQLVAVKEQIINGSSPQFEFDDIADAGANYTVAVYIWDSVTYTPVHEKILATIKK